MDSSVEIKAVVAQRNVQAEEKIVKMWQGQGQDIGAAPQTRLGSLVLSFLTGSARLPTRQRTLMLL